VVSIPDRKDKKNKDKKLFGKKDRDKK